jgi:hypothetical protein
MMIPAKRMKVTLLVKEDIIHLWFRQYLSNCQQKPTCHEFSDKALGYPSKPESKEFKHPQSSTENEFKAQTSIRELRISVVRFHVLTTVSMKFKVFWDVAPCSHFEVDRHFRGAYCLHYPHHPDDEGSTHL